MQHLLLKIEGEMTPAVEKIQEVDIRRDRWDEGAYGSSRSLKCVFEAVWLIQRSDSYTWRDAVDGCIFNILGMGCLNEEEENHSQYFSFSSVAHDLHLIIYDLACLQNKNDDFLLVFAVLMQPGHLYGSIDLPNSGFYHVSCDALFDITPCRADRVCFCIHVCI